MTTLEIACKHSISRYATLRNFIFGMLMVNIEKMVPIVFGGGQRSFGVTTGQNVNFV